MTTTVLPRGRQTKLRLAYEATYGVNPAANFSEVNAYAATFSRARALVADDILGGGLANTVDTRPAAPNVEDASGKLTVPLDLGQIGFWLGAAVGRVTATGTTPKVHAFASGNTSIPSLFLEREFVAGAQYEALRGGVVKTLKLPFGAGSGYQQLDIDLDGSQVLEPYTTTAAGTPTVEALVTRAPKFTGLIKVAGTQIGSIISGDITLTNTITLDRYVGDSAFPSLAALEDQAIAVTMSARYNTDVLRAYGSLGSGILPTAQTVEIDYTVGAATLAVVLNAVRFEPVDVPTSNGKTMTLSLKGMAEVGTSNPMLNATLTNTHASY